MTRLLLCAALLVTLPVFAQTDETWVLGKSALTYHISHPMHEVDGVSRAAKGKGTCHAGECDFLIAAEVKTFDSGDSNRDLHMLQVTRGAQFPLVTVRLRLAQAALGSPTLDCDLEVQFAGSTAHYPHVEFHQMMEGTSRHVTGTVPATLTDFKIEAPTFLTVPIKNAIPVRVDMMWQPG